MEQLLVTYLTEPATQKASFLAELPRQQRRELLKVLKKRGIPVVDPSAVALEVNATLDRKLERHQVEYGEHNHYFHPRETEIDRHFKSAAADLLANGKGPPPIDTCRHNSHSLVQEIMGLQNRLKLLLVQHKDLICAKWNSMSNSQKQKVLLAAWPQMPATHRPDIAAYDHGVLQSFDSAPKSHAWPYINLEDLLPTKHLLIFLDTRARHAPDKFAYFDLEMAPLYKLRKEYLDLRKDNFTMNFLGRTSCDNYAEIVEWAHQNERLKALSAGRTVHVDHGLQILTIQKGSLDFLSRCAEQLVEGVAPATYALVLPRNQAETFDLTDNVDGCILPHIVAREAPYRLPITLNLERLCSLVSAQKCQSIEHVWALREDPAYFADAVEQKRSHRCEFVRDSAGNINAKHAKDFPLYNNVLGHLIMDAHCLVSNWDHILKGLDDLREMSNQYSDDIRVDKDLPTRFLNKLAETRYFIESVSRDLVTMIRANLIASPPLRAYFYRGSSEAARQRLFGVLPRYKNPDQYGQDLGLLLRWFDRFEDKGSRNFFTLHVMMDEIERLMQTNAKVKALISPYVASLISQLAIIAECIHQLHSFQPWARKVESVLEHHCMTFSDKYNALLKRWARIDRSRHTFDSVRCCSLGNPRDGKFHYPTQARRNRANVNRLRSAEAALDSFWEAADAHWLSETGFTPLNLIRHIIGKRELYRTPIWVEPIRTPKDIDSPKINSAKIEAEAATPFADHVHDVSKEFTGSYVKAITPENSKQKTHASIVVENDRSDELRTVTPVESIPVHAVDKRSLKVFNTLFHSPDSPSQAGEITWNDFLHAMVIVGFGVEKLQGSAWHFTPVTLSAERSIQFHEPHPGNKLPFVVGKRHGRRLNRAFGWTGESFELAQK